MIKDIAIASELVSPWSNEWNMGRFSSESSCGIGRIRAIELKRKEGIEGIATGRRCVAMGEGSCG